jgi:hypothetical protein
VGKFWDSIGEKLAERWATVSIPALVFWLGGLLAWLSGHGGFHALKAPADWLGEQPGPTQIVVLIAALLGVAASGIVVGRLTTPVLRLMEGYWPRFLDFVRRPLVERVQKKADSIRIKFQAVAEPVLTGVPSPTPQQQAEYIRLTQRWRRLPGQGRYQPTRIGNTLRAGESRPVDKYGLDAVAVWPHLWLLLPETVRSELTAARGSLDAAVGAFIWGVLFVVFTPWTPWAAVAGLVVAGAAYCVWVPDRAEVYADLVEAAFDLHRGALYTQLRWPMPENPQDERAKGRGLTTYLLRGTSGSQPSFTSSAANPTECPCRAQQISNNSSEPQESGSGSAGTLSLRANIYEASPIVRISKRSCAFPER